MPTRKAPQHNLAGEGRMKVGAALLDAQLPPGAPPPGPLTKREVHAAVRAMGGTVAQAKAAAAAHTDGQPFPVGLTAANPGGIVLARKMQFLDFLFGATAMSAADGTLYLGLVTGTYTGGTSDINILQGTFTGNPEVTTTNWTDYAVLAITNNATNWSNATGVAGTQVATKNNAVIFTIAANAHVTGTGPTPTGWFLANSATLRAAANILATGNLTAGSTAVLNGAAVTFPVGSLPITIT